MNKIEWFSWFAFLASFGAVLGVAFFPDAQARDWVIASLSLCSLPALLWMVLLAQGRLRTPFKVLLVVGFAVRILFMFCDPLLSDDVYRYVWDGYVQVGGESPYGQAPNSEQLDPITQLGPEVAALRSKVNHPDIPTVYPPVLEMFFAAASYSGGLLSWRLMCLLAELLIVFILVRIFVEREMDSRWVFLYWLHPLPIFENIWSAHAEGIAVALFFTGCYLLHTKRKYIGVALLSLAGAAKLIPYGIGLYLWRRFGWQTVVLLGAVSLVCLVPYASTDLSTAFAGLKKYAGGWYFNDMVFRPLGELLGLSPHDNSLESTQFWRKGLLLLWVWACVLVCVFEKRSLHAGLWIGLSFVVLSPTLHPWYLLWVLPFSLATTHMPSFLLSSSILMSYALYVPVGVGSLGRWVDRPLVLCAEFLPALIWICVGCLWSSLGSRGSNEK